MNIVEKEAIRIKTKFFQASQTLESAKDFLYKKLIVFNRDKDKLYFLSVLRKELDQQKIDHEKTCTTSNCGTCKNLDISLFVIDQEIDELSKFYEPSISSEDEFSTYLRIEIHSRINEVINKLEKLELGQEIIFNEIDEMKEHFNLGKKKWLQLLKGKLIELGLTYAVEKSILDTIYNSLVQDLGDSATSFIDTLIIK